MFREELLDHINKTIDSSITYAVTWIGEGCVIVEGQKGVRSYSDERVSIKIDKKYISIIGVHLTIRDIHDRDIVIEGEIRGVVLDD